MIENIAVRHGVDKHRSAAVSQRAGIDELATFAHDIKVLQMGRARGHALLGMGGIIMGFDDENCHDPMLLGHGPELKR